MSDLRIIGEDWLRKGPFLAADFYADEVINLLDFSVLEYWEDSVSSNMGFSQQRTVRR